MTQKELAARLGRPPQVINEIIRAKKAITPDTAIGLGKVLGIAPQHWINLETDYRMTLACNREEAALADNVEWLDAYPVMVPSPRSLSRNLPDPSESPRSFVVGRLLEKKGFPNNPA